MENRIEPYEDALSVAELNEIISRIFKSEEMLHGIYVRGEISGFKASGVHAYFTLKDESAQIQCCCFSYRKTYVPKNGEAVILKATPDYWAPGGRLSLVVETVTPYGLGILYQKIQETKERLKALGVFDEDKKALIPTYPDSVCVVTSKSGAVIRDIITTVRRKNRRIDITVCDVRVQGERAEEDICRALKNIDGLGFDVVIIARGGGSLEDLMPFYGAKLAVAVSEMKTPVISAVGHETDFSICDMAADLRAATPTAAAEYIAYDESALKNAVEDADRRMKRLIIGVLERKRLNLISAIKSLHINAAGLLAEKRLRFVKAAEALSRRAEAVYISKSDKLGRFTLALDKLSPLKLLSSGYFKLEKQGLPIAGVSKLGAGDVVTLYGFDGSAEAEILKSIS